MANQQLIQMAKDLGASKGFTDIGGAFTESFGKWVDEAQKNTIVAAKKHEESNSRVVEYMEAIPNGNLAKVPLNQREAFSGWLTEGRKKYSDAAQATSKFKPGTPEYQEQVKIMNDVQQSFLQADSEFTDLLERKTEYMDAAYNNEISRGNNPDERSIIDGIMLDTAPLSFNETGNIQWGEDGKGIGDIPKWYGTEEGEELHDNLLQGLSGYTAAGYEITGGLEAEVQNKVYSSLKKAGRNAVQSLALDVAIGSGGERGFNISEELVRDPERYDELLDAVTEFMVVSTKNSAKAVKEAQEAKAEDTYKLRNKYSKTTTKKTTAGALDDIFLAQTPGEAADEKYGDSTTENAQPGPQLQQ